jgi:hypothetical protein
MLSMIRIALIVAPLFLVSCDRGEKSVSQKRSIVLSRGFDLYPLGQSIFSIAHFPLGDTVYEANWSGDSIERGYSSGFSRLWRLRWGDFSYYSGRDGLTVFFKRGIIFAQLFSSRGSENEYDLANGIHIGMSEDSCLRILGIPPNPPSFYRQYVTDSLAVFTKENKVVSYCILSSNIQSLFCSGQFRGLIGFVRASIDTAVSLGMRVNENNCLCVDEERDKYRIQFEHCHSADDPEDHRSSKFEPELSSVLWFDKATKNLIQYQRSRLGR